MIDLNTAVGFIPKSLSWSPDGKAMLLKGKSHFCVFFQRSDEECGDEEEGDVGVSSAETNINTVEALTS